ncbi:unnamed protein product [Microthlaspi erraticum]|uniref:Disease resistance protein Roq1-like winged-helix domain-containing protein n=1 Tax=Microthlaspi erraticum TaxID=1685480 RepID=A0A6D2JFF2_9BRAS|nr:unnamed protein product [Microthlaspi erraticum]
MKIKEALKCAFGEVLPEKAHLKMSEMVVKYASGNAKVLGCYGSQLKGKSSYYQLSDNEKSLFLDIACFLSGQSVEHVIQALKWRVSFIPIEIHNLFDKSLVSTISTHGVEMHELVQDVACEVIKIWKGRRLCGAQNIQPLLEDEESKSNRKNIESILLDASGLSFVVNPLRNLRLLKIYSSDPKEHLKLRLQKGLFYLPPNLRLLHLTLENLISMGLE